MEDTTMEAAPAAAATYINELSIQIFRTLLGIQTRRFKFDMFSFHSHISAERKTRWSQWITFIRLRDIWKVIFWHWLNGEENLISRARINFSHFAAQYASCEFARIDATPRKMVDYEFHLFQSKLQSRGLNLNKIHRRRATKRASNMCTSFRWSWRRFLPCQRKFRFFPTFSTLSALEKRLR